MIENAGKLNLNSSKVLLTDPVKFNSCSNLVINHDQIFELAWTLVKALIKLADIKNYLEHTLCFISN